MVVTHGNEKLEVAECLLNLTLKMWTQTRPWQHRGREAQTAFYQFQSALSLILLVWPSGGLISCFLSAEGIGLGMAASGG